MNYVGPCVKGSTWTARFPYVTEGSNLFPIGTVFEVIRTSGYGDAAAFFTLRVLSVPAVKEGGIEITVPKGTVVRIKEI